VRLRIIVFTFGLFVLLAQTGCGSDTGTGLTNHSRFNRPTKALPRSSVLQHRASGNTNCSAA
jgi:hypothetical protein